MAVKILDNSSNTDDIAAIASPLEAASPVATIVIPLVAGDEAVFSVPTVRHLKQAERPPNLKKPNPELSPTDLCRKLAELCLIRWGDRTSLPPDDEIDAEDDMEVLSVFLKQMGTEQAEDGIDGSPESPYEVLPDKSHQVKLQPGAIIFRRLTRRDIRSVENSKQGNVANEIMLACSACSSWWRGDRPIMPADFDPLTLADYSKVSAALQGFLRRDRSSL